MKEQQDDKQAILLSSHSETESENFGNSKEVREYG